MFELVYCSTGSSVGPKDITDILKTSRTFNLKNDITGCLLYHNDEFIQILEGNQDIVQQLFERIRKDKRHYGVTLLTESAKTQRAFPEWSMAYHSFGTAEAKNIGQALFKDNFIAFSNFSEKPTQAVQLFWYMVKQLLTHE